MHHLTSPNRLIFSQKGEKYFFLFFANNRILPLFELLQCLHRTQIAISQWFRRRFPILISRPICKLSHQEKPISVFGDFLKGVRVVQIFQKFRIKAVLVSHIPALKLQIYICNPWSFHNWGKKEHWRNNINNTHALPNYSQVELNFVETKTV